MNYSTLSNHPATTAEGDVLLLSIYQEGKLSNAADAVDQATQGSISACLEFGDFTGKTGQTHLIYQTDGIKASRVLLVGVGESENFDAFSIKKATASALKSLSNQAIESVVSYLGDDLQDTSAVVTQTILAAADSQYQFTVHKSEPDAAPSDRTLTIAFTNETDTLDATLNNAQGMAVGTELSRDLSNQPGNVCTPTYLADTAKALASTYDALDVEILEESDMEALGMGSFLSVSLGSDQPGKLVVLKYNGAKDNSEAPIALVGKGVTFDTGGISLKPGASMDEMKFDMVGAASVLGTIK
ncbi:UNVERIFIED_CONTAM: hypothetical protein GTU68_037404, partial [Idotea baltica]|nr:hypothetical protein [Idotea baltica]